MMASTTRHCTIADDAWHVVFDWAEPVALDMFRRQLCGTSEQFSFGPTSMASNKVGTSVIVFWNHGAFSKRSQVLDRRQSRVDRMPNVPLQI